MRDVADFTSNLIEWAGDSLPGLKIRAAGANSFTPPKDSIAAE